MNWFSNWRPFNHLPPKVVLWLLPLSFAALVALLCYSAWLLTRGAAPGIEDRYVLVLIGTLVLQRYLASSGLKPSVTKNIIDVFLCGALAICVLWFVRTAGARPFGFSAALWYAGAYIGGQATGFIVERLRSKRAMSVSN